ncbi:MAG: cation-translocating P-type ATPase [Polynucleobacter sp.]|nr:cation-translocating P-type ATPase [Polynucleobacter sp.]
MAHHKSSVKKNSVLTGLSNEQVAQRLLEEGTNDLGLSQRRTLLVVMRDVLFEPMFLLLLAAGAIYLLTGERNEAMVLLGFVLVIMGMTVFQERRTDNALAALRDLSSPRALVIRSGVEQRIAGHEVVREDVLILAEGDRVPADGTLLQAHELSLDESMLTGESEPVSKTVEQSVFAGTLVVSGQGVVSVTLTGRNTQMGKIGQSLDEIEPQASPLREQMSSLTKRLAIIGIIFSLSLMVLFWWLRGGWLDAMLAGIGLAMALLPQEFAVIMIIFFAFAARRLGKQHVLTRRLHAIETLGETTVLCVDKTGTLTQNRMQVEALCTLNEQIFTTDLAKQSLPPAFHELLEYAVLASEIAPHDPMEKAFHRLTSEQLQNDNRRDLTWVLAREYELSPQLLAMTHLWRLENTSHDLVAAKGAPEAVAALCHLSTEQEKIVLQQAEALATRGLRVLAVAEALHPTDQPWPSTQHDFDFEWLGLIALADPLRPEVAAAVEQCHRAGIRVIMITGDHPRTAIAIARQAGLEPTGVLTGDEIAGMDQTTLNSRIQLMNVFARVKPHQKLALVESLKAQGEIVAMTGDGVNDAPALKAAHIGIAMGERGTDVAREAASLVLLKDDFNSIVHAIREGRRTFANMRQAMIYTLAVHVPIAGLALLPVLVGLPLFLAPLHIAFLELVIDPACSVVFEAEQARADIMDHPPRSITETLLSTPQVIRSLVYGAFTTAGVFAYYTWMLNFSEPSSANACAFVMLVTANAVLILATRSAYFNWKDLWSRFTPISLWVLAVTFVALLTITTYVPLAEAFRFTPVSTLEWTRSLLFGLFMLPIFLGLKWLAQTTSDHSKASMRTHSH